MTSSTPCGDVHVILSDHVRYGESVLCRVQFTAFGLGTYTPDSVCTRLIAYTMVPPSPPSRSTTPDSDSDEQGDVIVRSSDDQDFTMYMLDLTRASPVFETMFSLPQPTAAQSGDEWEDELPVVSLAESGEVLEALFEFCLPWRRPKLSDLSRVVHVYQAAEKYEMDGLVEAVREAMRELAEKEPIRVYAVACRFGLEEEARLAARFGLRMRTSDILAFEAEEIEHLTGIQFRRLLKYKDDCQNAATDHMRTAVALSSGDRHKFGYWDLVQSDRSCSGRTSCYKNEWWTAYIAQATESLKDCTWEGTIRAEDILLALVNNGGVCLTCGPKGSNYAQQMGPLAQRIATNIAKILSEVRVIFAAPNNAYPFYCTDYS